MKTFYCEGCNQTFECGDATEEEKIAEAEENFGEGCMGKLDMASLCEDCFEKMRREIAPYLVNKLSKPIFNF